MNPASVTGGSSSTGTATLTSAAPVRRGVVALSGDSTAATVPASATVRGGSHQRELHGHHQYGHDVHAGDHHRLLRRRHAHRHPDREPGGRDGDLERDGDGRSGERITSTRRGQRGGGQHGLGGLCQRDPRSRSPSATAARPSGRAPAPAAATRDGRAHSPSRATPRSRQTCSSACTTRRRFDEANGAETAGGSCRHVPGPAGWDDGDQPGTCRRARRAVRRPSRGQPWSGSWMRTRTCRSPLSRTAARRTRGCVTTRRARATRSTSRATRSCSRSRSARATRGVALGAALPRRQPAGRAEGDERAPGEVNYLRGNDPARWQTGLPRYAQVVYRELWPGVDLMLREQAGS